MSFLHEYILTILSSKSVNKMLTLFRLFNFCFKLPKFSANLMLNNTTLGKTRIVSILYRGNINFDQIWWYFVNAVGNIREIDVITIHLNMCLFCFVLLNYLIHLLKSCVIFPQAKNCIVEKFYIQLENLGR